MDLICQCVERYTKEYELYAEVARVAATHLEASLAEAGVRAIVTHRAKHPSRLENKLRKRAPDKAYTSVDHMYEDIIDLAGVRVALYFPGDRDLVGTIIKRNFVEIEPEREFPDPRRPSAQKKFSGYTATHYRVLLPGNPGHGPGPMARASIEIQVASVLMHGWAEVEHDLAYKPTQGELSARELALLDQLNGLVIAGEIALEQLQAAGRERVGELHRPFRSHYDLAAYLIQRAEEDHHLSTVPEEGLGRVDLLFELLSRLGLGTPNGVQPYLRQLHRDLDRRPLAEQVINAILAEDASRYAEFAAIRKGGNRFSDPPSERPDPEVAAAFLSEWIKLETVLQRVLPPMDAPVYPPTSEALTGLGVLERQDLLDLARMWGVRNAVVHGTEVPAGEALAEATGSIRLLTERLTGAADDGVLSGDGPP